MHGWGNTSCKVHVKEFRICLFPSEIGAEQFLTRDPFMLLIKQAAHK